MVNGKPDWIPKDISLIDYLQVKNINPNIVVCELNEKILRRTQLDHTRLKKDDSLEIIRMMGGG